MRCVAKRIVIVTVMDDKYPSLPPGVTPSDIDEHFGGPEPREHRVGVTIGVDVTVRARNEDEIDERVTEQLETLAEANPTTIDFVGWEIEEIDLAP